MQVTGGMGQWTPLTWAHFDPSPWGKLGLLFAHLYGIEHEKWLEGDHLRGDWDVKLGRTGKGSVSQHFTTTPPWR